MIVHDGECIGYNTHDKGTVALSDMMLDCGWDDG